MISIYVCHRFIEEFQKRNDFSNDVIYDFRKQFLKRISGVDVISDIDFDKIEELVNENEFYSDLASINGISCDNSWLGKLEDESFLYQGNLSKVFLLGNDVDCDSLVTKYNLLFINNLNLEKVWSMVRTDRDISEMIPTNTKENDFSFDSWKKLLNFKHPFHDILIFDLYLLGNKNNQKINNNLKPMLETFSNFTSNGIFELTIIAKEISKPRDISNPVEKIAEVYSLINRDSCKLIYYDAQKASIPEHDRQIFTNYMLFDCGAGWNIFKEKGGVNTSTKIIGRSIFRNDSKNSAKSALGKIKEYYSAIKDSKLRIPIAGQFDENNRLKYFETDYHYPLEFSPKILD